jgi:hypothetical protein
LSLAFPIASREPGAWRERVLFGEDDYLRRANAAGIGAAVFCDCLTPSHFHLILVPDHAEALPRTLL